MLFIGTYCVAGVVLTAIVVLFRLFFVDSRRSVRDGGGRPPIRVMIAVSIAVFVGVVLVSKRPLFAVFLAVAAAVLVHLVHRYRKGLDRARLAEQALSHLYGLKGLIQVGLSYPVALLRLNEEMPSDFSRLLGRELRYFGEGRPLVRCLERFRQRLPDGSTSLVYATLQLVYERGLPVLPILERTLPLLESERVTAEELRNLRHGALLQVIFAGCLPLGVTGCLFLFEPETVLNFVGSKWFVPLQFFLGIYQLSGMKILWRLSHFY